MAFKALELKVPPPVAWLATGAAAVGLAVAFPQWNFPFVLHRALALALAAAGVASGIAGVAAFRRHGTTIDPHRPQDATAFVCTGIYRHTRNPMYLGLALTLLGIAAWFASPLALLPAAAFCAWLTRFQIKPEERVLGARFGAPYAAYLQRVRRWI